MQATALVDIAGRRRSPATLLSFHQGRPPRNKAPRYPADPPTVEQIVAVMRAAGDHADGTRLRDLIVILWRAGLRISEALALTEGDLDASRGAILVRRAPVQLWSRHPRWATLHAAHPRHTSTLVQSDSTPGARAATT